MPARETLLRDIDSVKQSLINTHYQVELGNELKINKGVWRVALHPTNLNVEGRIMTVMWQWANHLDDIDQTT